VGDQYIHIRDVGPDEMFLLLLVVEGRIVEMNGMWRPEYPDALDLRLLVLEVGAVPAQLFLRFLSCLQLSSTHSIPQGSVCACY